MIFENIFALDIFLPNQLKKAFNFNNIKRGRHGI